MLRMGNPSVSVGSAMSDGGVPVRLLPDHLIAIGEPVATTSRVSELVGLAPRSLHAGLSRLRRQGRLFSPTRGLYVAIPPQYRSWGVVPASWWIDAMMAHLGRGYYVALLTAAAIHGAAHQSPQVFQVVVDRQVADRDLQRVRLRFHVSAALPSLPDGAVVRVATETGSMAVSSRELTAIDLAANPTRSGGLDNVATVLVELGELDTDLLAAIGPLYPRATIRRLGWLLDEIVDVDGLDALKRFAEPAVSPPTPLDVAGPSRAPRNTTWGIVENATVEPDR